jgi:BON domain
MEVGMPTHRRRTARSRRSYPAYVADPGGPPRGDYDDAYAGSTGELDQDEYGDDQQGGDSEGRGPFEQSQRFGGDGFSAGTGAFGILQRQYENRYVAGGYPGSLGDRHRYCGPGDDSSKQRAHEGEYWHGRDNPLPNRPLGDTGTRRWEQGPYYGALSVADESPRRRRPASARTAGPPRAADEWGEWHPGPAARLPVASPLVDAVSAARRRSRAPKGYRRSDARILGEVCERLAPLLARLDASLAHQHRDPIDVTVSVHDATARLEGTAPVRGMKYHIEDIVAAVPGVRDVDNRLRVPRPP